LAIPAHVFATLFLSGRELSVRNRARHDRPSQQENSEQDSKINNKLHRLELTTAGGAMHFFHVRLMLPDQPKIQKKPGQKNAWPKGRVQD
jgi:hypothetical protein